MPCENAIFTLKTGLLQGVLQKNISNETYDTSTLSMALKTILEDRNN
jgi:hypothetical protein